MAGESVEENDNKKISVISIIDPPWKKILDLITYKLEPMYHTIIAEKLKRITKLK
jgi:hypothetical protein